jgi:hypothetical protein
MLSTLFTNLFFGFAEKKPKGYARRIVAAATTNIVDLLSPLFVLFLAT